jgi:hypothetical protein
MPSTARSARGSFCHAATYIETQLAPTIKIGIGIILDNLITHKSQNAAEILNTLGSGCSKQCVMVIVGADEYGRK